MAARSRGDPRIRNLAEGVSDEVHDIFPGLPDEEDGSKTNTVSADAYLALKTAFNDLKNRLVESEQRNEQLRKRSKKKGSDSALVQQAQQEKEMMIQKSYAAFQEKYAENEELRKELANLEGEYEKVMSEYKEREEELTKGKDAESQELQKKLADLRGEYEELTREYKNLEALTKEKDAEGQKLRKELTNLKEESENMIREYEKREEERTKKKDAGNQELRKTLDDSRAEYEAFKKECKEKEEELTKKNDAVIRELQKKLADSRAQWETLAEEFKRREEECAKELKALTIENRKISEDFCEQKCELERLRTSYMRGNKESNSQETPEAIYGCSQMSSTDVSPLATLLKRVEDCGLQVIERHRTAIFVVSDREKLRTHLEQCEDDDVRGIFERLLSEESLETPTFYSQEQYNSLTRMHREAEGKVIRLKQTIEDQAQEIRRLRKLCSDVMHIHSKCNEKKQKSLESEAKELVQYKLGEGSICKKAPHVGVAEIENPLDEERLKPLLKKAVGIIAQLNELFRELEAQERLLQQIIEFTQKSTRTLSEKAKESYNTNRRILIGQPIEPGIDDAAGNLYEDDSKYLSIAVQETGTFGGSVGVAGGEIRRSPGGGASHEDTGEEEEPPLVRPVTETPSDEGASGRVGPRHKPEKASENFRASCDRAEWTGESDIEVIEESEQPLGAASTQGRICPVCEHPFPSSYSQEMFVQHVRNHFQDD